MSAAPRSGFPVPRASRALGNLRGFVILLVLAFHSVLAYLNFLPASPFPFDTPPYLWRAFPIVDTERWFGFDLFCAWHALALSQHWLAIADLVPLLAVLPCAVMMFHCMKGMNHGQQTDTVQASLQNEASSLPTSEANATDPARWAR